MPVRLFAAVLACLLIFPCGCREEKVPAQIISMDPASTLKPAEVEQRDKLYKKLSIDFGRAIKDENWQAAYDMCSTSLKVLLPPQKFADTFRANYKEYHQFGKPTDVSADINTVDPADLDRDEYMIPQSVPSEPRWEAYSFAEMIVQGTAQEPDRCYNIALLWTKENGQDRVCYFEFEWCD